MAENTNIEWCHHTFNHVRGCTKISAECDHCYAETMSGRNPKTLGIWGKFGTRAIAAESYWRQPLQWNKAAERYPDECGKCGVRLSFDPQSKMQRTESPVCPSQRNEKGEFDPTRPECGGRILRNVRPRVFCASLADVFEGENTMPESSVPLVRDARRRLFKLIERTPNLNWLLLTKRPENIFRLTYEAIDPADDPDCDFNACGDPNGLSVADYRELYPNIWLGTSVGERKTKHRIDALRQIPAAVRFLSIEPLLEDLGELDLTNIDWVIVGGESGHNARPMHPAWVQSIRDQCVAAGVPFLFKQWGEWVSEFHDAADSQKQQYSDAFITKIDEHDYHGIYMFRAGKKAAGRILDGRTWDEYPEACQSSVGR